MVMYVKDFNGNGHAEPVLTLADDVGRWPLPLRDDMIRAYPPLKPRYMSYTSYARATVDSIFPPDKRSGAIVRTANTLATTLVRNEGNGSFTLVPLPREAQLAPVYGILADDLDGDGKTDLLLGGNFDGFKPEIGRAAASYGLVLRGDGSRCRGQDTLCVPFTPVRAAESGFFVPGQVRDIRRVRTPGGAQYLVARNDARALLFRRTPRDRAPTTVAAGH